MMPQRITWPPTPAAHVFRKSNQHTDLHGCTCRVQYQALDTWQAWLGQGAGPTGNTTIIDTELNAVQGLESRNLMHLTEGGTRYPCSQIARDYRRGRDQIQIPCPKTWQHTSSGSPTSMPVAANPCAVASVALATSILTA